MAPSFRLAANISWLFKEYGPNLVSRLQAAKQAGFSAIEIGYPYSTPIAELVEGCKAAQFDVALINSFPGDLEKGEMGLACHSNRTQEFRDTLEKSIQYCTALRCPRIHVMAGKIPEGVTFAEAWTTYTSHLQFACERLAKDNIEVVIEPINTRKSAPGYLLDTPSKAVEAILSVARPNLKMLLDIYHLQMIEGSLTMNLSAYLPHVAHIQIAQAPSRAGPFQPGEINYSYVLDELTNLGYNGLVGLEFIASDSTEDDLHWFKENGFLSS